MSKVLTVNQGDYVVQVDSGQTIIDSDIIVKGTPYGTAPVVTNILYVTTDGSDTNDGSAEDPTRACRTISGAVKSPLYQSGTSIKVAPGRYLENNPIVVKPYTSIIGSDLRTSSIEPINKTQDLFHVNSSSYLAQMQFLNGRSGIVDPNLDRGAYAVSFPINYKFTFTGNTTIGSTSMTAISNTANIVIGMEIISPIVVVDGISVSLFPIGTTVISIDSDTQITMSTVAIKDTYEAIFTTGKITVYKSPYVQNCTNQSGPWLYDGTMFIPNQTVQLPLGVGTTTFNDGDETIVVAVSEGTIEVGMSINTAPQDQGFFTARTLILANVQFIQEQALEYIAQTYPTTDTLWDSFNNVYDPEEWRRDIRIIIEHVLYDTTFGGNSKTVQSGSAYWDGAVSVISGQQTQTVDALDYIKELVTDIISDANTGNSTVPDLFIGTSVVASSIVTGSTYTIVEIGDTDFTQIGASSNTIGVVFVATAVGRGSGTAKYGKPAYTPSNLKNSDIALTPFSNNIDIIKTIILDSADTPAIFYSTGPEFGLDSAELLLQANRAYIQDDIISFISSQYPSFLYDTGKSVRDVGYIIDAISQDILLGGNARSFEAGISYYVDNESVLSNLETSICLAAFDELSIIMQSIVQNATYSPAWASGNIFQTKNTKWSNGGITVNYIIRNITIIKSIITNGPAYAKTQYVKNIGTALFSATGISADNVQQSTKVTLCEATGVDGYGNTIYNVTLSIPTVGIGSNSTLYFGYTSVYPLVETNIPDRWANRKCDPWGAMGGMIIDGDVVTDNSPIRSFVADAFTQVNQGGRGIRVTNKGYVQLVSVFTIFSSIAVQADNGGIASITNSNANFGTYCMIAKGYGPREFSGTLYNPAGFSYNSISNSFIPNQYYPSGFFPYTQQVCVFVPDTQYRPHIALMMEVIPPTTYVNAQGKPGFLTATVTFSTITQGDLTISGIDVSNMYIGQTLYLRDQYGNDADLVTGISYLQPDTIITDMGPQTLYLNKSITQSGGDVNNPSFFTLFSCGNAYYTILSSQIANNPSLMSDTTTPISAGGLILPTNQSTGSDSNNPEVASLEYLASILQSVVANSLVASPKQTIVTQETNNAYNGTDAVNLIYGDGIGLIDNTITILKGSDIITPLLLDTENNYDVPYIVEQVDITLKTSGVVTSAAGDAAQLILLNLEFCVEEITAYIQDRIANATYGNNWYQLIYNTNKCRRDVRLICINIAYDLTNGGNYNSVYSGLSYYSRPGTYHIVQLEDNVTNFSLVPDGAIVNFYQRSYMSASGYLFEYVGAGTNYGALPQVGRVDPNQPNEVNMLDGGKVFFTSTDQNGDFRIGPSLVISQATGVISGRTFQKSLFAEITPFILAIEG